MFNNKKAAIVICGAQILIALVIILIIIYKKNNPYLVEVDLSELKTSYMSLDKDILSVSTNDLPEEYDKIDLNYGPYISLAQGSYTLVIEYNADTQQKCQISSVSNGYSLKANTFNLSRNKKVCRYDFYLTQKIDDIEIKFVDYTQGDFDIYSVYIIENTHNLRLILFILIIMFCIIDSFLYLPAVRKRRKIIMGIIGIALLASLITFMKGMPIGDDYGFHLARIESIANGLKAGKFPVKMHSFFNDGYGYPVGVFYGDALLYMPAILRLIGFTVMTSYKAYIWFVNLLTALSAYWCGKKIFKNTATPFIFSLAYVTANYRMMDIFARSAVGEYTAFIFYPMIILAIYNIYTQDGENVVYKKNSYYLAFGMCGLLYTHILSTEMVVFILLVFAVIFIKKTIQKTTMLVYFKAIVISVFVGSGFWVPFLDYYINADVAIKDTVSDANTHIQYLGAYFSDYFAVFRSYYGGSGVNVVERLQLTPGLTLMLALMFALFFTFYKKLSRIIVATEVSAIALLYVASDVFPWDLLAKNPIGNILVQVQFPWRYIGPCVGVLALLLGLLIEEESIINDCGGKNLYYIITIICIISSLAFVSDMEDTAIQTNYIDSAELPQYTYGPDGLSWLMAREYIIPETDIYALNYECIGKDVNGIIISENELDMELYIATSAPNAYIDIPRFDYPYFAVKDKKGNSIATERGDNNKIRLLFDDVYKGNVFVKFIEPWYWRVAEIISICGMIFSLLYFIRTEKTKIQ